VTAALGHLRGLGLPAARCAVAGFCMGGSVAFSMAAGIELGAAVTFCGGGVAEGRFGFPAHLAVAPALRTPWLGLYGDQDQSIAVEQVETLRERTAQAAVATQVVRYPNAGHGFNCDARASLVPDAAADAWSRTLGWLGAHLAGAS
jgi:carboxymethylenebutenolidase